MTIAAMPATLLIIDDQPANIKVLNELLKDEYRVLFALEGAEGLELASKQQPDLVLLDVVMPTMDGHEVCRQLKQNPVTRQIPIIFITSMQLKEFETTGLLLGAVDYVTKPFYPEIVKLRIQNQLELKRHRDHLEQIVAEQTQQLRLAKEAAEAGERAKRDLLMLFSHELRTPLNGIIGFTDLLLSANPTRQQEEYLNIVSRSAHVLAGMVEGILELMQIELDAVQTSSEPFDLAAVLREVVGRHFASARAKGVSVRILADLAGLPTVAGSHKHLDKILDHLLHNAVKFTEHGQIVLGVEPMAGRPGYLHFYVQDTGIGIDAAHQQFILDYFTQVEQVLTRQQGGLGLGLAYCRKALERCFAGRLWLESQAGQGSTFHFEARLCA
ncbi:MAG: response regulator [Magnetococcales bacterium]|nr:response regulator [Magnetococcales bacterium]